MALKQLVYRGMGVQLDNFDQIQCAGILLALVLIWLMTSWLSESGGPKASFVGFRFPFEPKVLVRTRFMTQGLKLMDEGYNRWKTSMFKIATHDADWLILSQRYLGDLQSLPSERLSHTDALVTVSKSQTLNNNSNHEVCAAAYTRHLVVQNSRCGAAVMDHLLCLTKVTWAHDLSGYFKNVLAPNYVNGLNGFVEELRYSFDHDVPECNDWSTVDVLTLSFKLGLRISQRILIGEPMSRDQELLDCVQGYTDAATVVQFSLKALPRLLRPLMYPLLPASWQSKAWIRKANKILAREIQRRRHLEKSDPGYEKPKDLLQGMVELDSCRSDHEFGHDFLVQSLVTRMSISTTMGRALIDLSLQPEAIDELRKEIVEVMGRDGESLSNLRVSLAKLDKMDSFIRESARMTPLSMTTIHRVVQDEAGITLHDGVHLPKGTHLALPAYNIGRDPDRVHNADVFDGFRWFRQRQQDRQSSDDDRGGKWQFATPDPNYLNFGSGKYVCPGRFIASHIIKLMMVAVLSRYNLKQAPGAPRPTQNYLYVFPIPDQPTLLIRRLTSINELRIF